MKAHATQIEFKVWQRFVEVCSRSEKTLIHLYSLVSQGLLSSYSDLPIDGIPFYISDVKSESHVQLSQEELIDHLLKSSFEEIINGFIFCLQDIYLYSEASKLEKKSQTKPLKSPEEIESIINDLKRSSEKVFFSELIRIIKTDFKVIPECIDEVESLNRLRIIITHRNSVVSQIDCNNGGQFVLKYLGLDTYVIINGESVKVDVAFKKENHPSEGIQFAINPKELNFYQGERVKIDFNQWTDFKLTLSVFLSSLIHLLPLPQNIKNAVPKVLEAKLEYK